MNKRKKQIKTLIILCFILIILISITCFAIKKNSNIDDDFQQYKAKVYDKMMEEMVMPNGTFELKKNYTGDYDLEDFYKSIKKFSGAIKELSKKDEKNLEEYFEKNKANIISNTGITEFEKFKSLKEYARKYGEAKSFISADIDTETIESTKKYLSFDMTLNFDGDKLYKFNVHLMNNRSSRIFVRYEVTEN